MVRICLYVHVCVAPPMIVGAWSMAVMLWQLYEYYYIQSVLVAQGPNLVIYKQGRPGANTCVRTCSITV